MDRKRLAMALSRIPDHPDPQSRYEQVRTPGDIAADLLVVASDEGHIAERRVVDLGCGTGVFAIGAALLDAERVVGVDLDEASLSVAVEQAARNDVTDRVRFLEVDVAELAGEQVTAALEGPADTVIMNPPFGADLASRARGGDRVFLALAFRLAPVVYSLHAANTEQFLVAFSRDAGYSVEKARQVDFPMPARFAHHKDLVRMLPVGMYRFVRNG